MSSNIAPTLQEVNTELALSAPVFLTGAEPFSDPHAYVVRDGAKILCTDERSNEPAEWQKRLLLEFGGRNRFGTPNYRLTWGWTRFWYYPTRLRYFHVERWLPPELFGTEEWWEHNNRIELAKNPDAFVDGFPRHGDYFWVETVAPEGRSPSRRTLEYILHTSHSMIDRTPQEIREEVRAQRVHQEVLKRKKQAQILEQTGVSEVLEHWVKKLKANPSARRALDSPFLEKERG